MALELELKNLGFSDKEARVYLALLELGEAPVQKISEKAKVNRATTYVVLEALQKRGIVSTVARCSEFRNNLRLGKAKPKSGAIGPAFWFDFFLQLTFSSPSLSAFFRPCPFWAA